MRALGIRALLLLVATLGVACSAVLPGSSENIRCVAPDPTTDPCLPARMRCVDGLCRSVCLEDEVCNGVDDDCNGVIDEGIDMDGDGYLGCGGGDCDDSNPDVNPGVAQDLCNNIDDDCDGLLDAADEDNFQRCPAGLVCIPRLAPDSCAEPNCTYPESPGCMMGFVCDTATGGCVPGDNCEFTGCLAGEVCARTGRCVVPAPLGSACRIDDECEDGRCYLTRETLRLETGVAAGTTGICGRACCTHTDCPSGFACWVPGTGARSCVPRSLLAAGPQGDLLATPCADGATCGANQCLLSTTNAYDRAELGSFFCAMGGGSSDAAACYDNTECRSLICLDVFRVPFLGDVGPCSGPCGSSEDCQGYASRYNGTFESSVSADVAMYCAYGQLARRTEWVNYCSITREGLAGPRGSCSSNDDCQDAWCDAGTCRAVCCSDADCQGDLCRPVNRGDHWEMRCQP